MCLTFLCIVYDVGQWIVMIDNRHRECSFLLPIKPVRLYVSLYGIISIFSCWVADYLVVKDGEGRHWDCSLDHFASDLNVEWGERLSDHLVLNEEILFWTFSSLWLSKLCELCDCDQDKFTSWFLRQKGGKARGRLACFCQQILVLGVSQTYWWGLAPSVLEVQPTKLTVDKSARIL